MKNSKKTIATTFSVILMLTIGVSMIALPLSNAHTPAWDIPTYAYVTASPSMVGIGQYTNIVMWLDKYPPTAGGLGGDRWNGFRLNITRPDGRVDTIGPQTSGPVGSTFATYTPDIAGDYSIVFSWPGQTLTNGTGVPNTSGLDFVGDHFQAATSEPFILHVQQNPIEQWKESPLPTDYWTTPINGANRDWTVLASNWLGGSWLVGNFQNEGQAPNSAHVLWQKPITAAYPGGINDAQWASNPTDVNDYEQPWSSPIIMNGVIYYNTPQTAESAKYGYYATNLYTGEQIWYKNGTDNGINIPAGLAQYSGLGGAGVYSGQTFAGLTQGQLYHYDSLNGNGILGYLWIMSGSTWYMIDPSTGNWIMTLKNVPSGTAVTDQDGSLLRYSYNAATGRFLAWNSSQSVPPASPAGTGQQQWKPSVGITIDAVNDTRWTQWGLVSDFDYIDIAPRSGYTMNVTGPTGLPPLTNVIKDANRVPKLMMFTALPSQTGLPGGTNDQTFPVAVVRIDENVAPYSPNPDKTNSQNTNLGFGVSLLFSKNFTFPLGGNRTWGFGPVSYQDDVFTIMCKESRQWWGYSLSNGTQLWGPTDAQGQWDMYQVSYTGSAGGNIAYGKLFSASYGGVLYAFDLHTGKTLWNYTAAQIGYESPYGNYPLSIGAIADGKVYLYSTEHSPTKPLWRGSYLRCVNATDGTEIWKLLDFNMGMGVSNGYIVTGSQYDNMVYAIGKGPSAITIEAPASEAATGHAMVIQGTVTDQSPGAQTISKTKGFMVPAISDADQQAYMEYLYEQQAAPTNTKGVPVTISAIDPNGNTIPIGTATSDSTGSFSFLWTTPNVAGSYTLTATFAGSESYYGSHAQTYAYVSEAAATHEATPTPAPSTDMALVGLGIAAIIAIVLVGLVLALMLRRRP